MTAASFIRFVATLLVIFTGAFIVIEWQHNTISTADDTLASLHAQYERLNATVKLETALDAEEYEAHQRLAQYGVADAKKARASEHESLSSIASASHVSLTDTNLDASGTVLVAARGSQNDVLRFIDQLDRLPVPVHVTTVTLTSQTGGLEVRIEGALPKETSS